jgi:8-oxo-dGTP pyrophosphatase MutT (NUDIX family)
MSDFEFAATVVLLRECGGELQVLLLERPRHTGSFSGVWVFPGGKIDPEDRAGEDVSDDVRGEPNSAPTAARHAAVRECREETGLQLSADDLVELSCWIPPVNASRRFQTWFFLAPVPPVAASPAATATAAAGEVRLNAAEIMDYAWLSPREALRRHGESLMQLVAPTWVTLHSLLAANSVEAAVDQARRRGPESFASRRLNDVGAGPVIVWAGDSEHRTTAPSRPGDPSVVLSGRHRLVMAELPWIYQRN